jgi:hypothetical protein
MERVARLPTRKELALRPLYIMVGSAGLVIAWMEFFGGTAFEPSRPSVVLRARLLATPPPLRSRIHHESTLRGSDAEAVDALLSAGQVLLMIPQPFQLLFVEPLSCIGIRVR